LLQASSSIGVIKRASRFNDYKQFSQLRASASVLVGREFEFQPGLIKTLQIGTADFLPGAQYTEELQGTGKRTRNCVNSVVALQDHCSYNAPTSYHKKTFFSVKRHKAELQYCKGTRPAGKMKSLVL